MSRKQSWKNSKCITAVILLLALAELGFVFMGNRLQMDSSRALQAAYNEQISEQSMAARLKESSDYLTNEVRLYAVTGEAEHFRNYWNEAEVERNREAVIAELEALSLPNEEKRCLERAKYFSDILMHIEISSLRLKLESIDADLDNVFGAYYDSEAQNGSSAEASDENSPASMESWIQYVLQYPLESDYDCAPEEKTDMAVRILYESPYMAYKKLIDSNIAKFREKMDRRLEESVEQSRQAAEQAYLLQTVCGIGELGIFVFILLLFQQWYIKPVVRYKKLIERQHGRRRMFVEPDGVWELQQFAEEFNALSSDMLAELDRSERIEKELIEARERAEKASQVKSRFLTQMSHELRTPLNTISGYLYLLEGTALSGEQKRYAENMQLASDILLEEINEILDYSRLESGRMQFEEKSFRLRALTDSLKAMLDNEAEQRGLQFGIDMPEEVPDFIMGDPLRLKQVLTNLLYNGFKFTKQGRVMLSVRLLEQGEKRCVLEFSVTDTGIGIPKDRQQSVFSAFTQADSSITRKYGGTGLGLPICRKMVEEMSHGQYSLLLESEEGKGSRFFFDMDFRYGEGTAENIGKPQTMHSLREKRKLSILIVDDNEINLVLESELLHKFGYRADIESDPQKVLPLIREKHYDIAFLDISMPGISGYELAELIRKEPGGKDLVLIALTANAGPEAEQKLKEAGMNGGLTKPIPMEKLQALLEKYTGEVLQAPKTAANAERNDVQGTASNVISIAQLEEQLYGDRGAVKELFGIFTEDNAGLSEALQLWLQQENWTELEAALHRLKGVSGNLLCRPLAAVAGECLEAAKKQELTEAQLTALSEALTSVLAEMAAYAGREQECTKS